MARLVLTVILTALLFNGCSRKPADNLNQSIAHSGEPEKTIVTDDLRRETSAGGIEVTFYPAYGYQSGTDWLVPIRSWVHEDRPLPARIITEIVARQLNCTGPETEILKGRLADFPDDDKRHEQVAIQFDADPDKEQYELGQSDANGLVEKELRLSEAKTRKLFGSQKTVKRWLTYHTVTKGQTGKGRIRLIEPDGVSVISDIDDTIKVTEVPAERAIVLRNTFCRDYLAAPGMAETYRGLGDIPFHYVSGGPWQLYAPLYDFLISGAAGYPEGSFHFSDFPKNIFAEGTIENLFQGLTDSLRKTYDHKVRQITLLLEKFPNRKFILIGDSGELDPEIYRAIGDKHVGQVQEIRIRDVVKDETVNPERLAGMTVINAPIICASESHYQKVSEMLVQLHRPAYLKNRAAPCN